MDISNKLIHVFVRLPHVGSCEGNDRLLKNRFLFAQSAVPGVESVRSHRTAGGKSKKAGPHDMIRCMTCKMWMDLKSWKCLTEMSQSERNKLVLDCWKCMVGKKVKMADVTMKMEEEKIKRLNAEAVSLRKKLENKMKLKGGECARSKRKVDGDVNDGARCISER
ncbi:hypothetical protein FHG87_008957 [Trinorchestia longiramus]|nr:hypothetical protein FHG87_008957 [Trinorchestia longiramus]